MSADPADLFLHIFGNVPFPFLAADLALLGDAMNGRKPGSYIRFPLPHDPSKRAVAVASLRGLLRQIDVPRGVVALMATSESMIRTGTSEKLLQSAATQGSYAIYEAGDQLVWEEEGPWPMAYSTFLTQLVGLLNLFSVATAERRASPDYAHVGMTLSEYPRQMPTQIHYAIASLGAWLGAPTNFQYLSFFAARPQMDDRSVNLTYARKIGYGASEAEMLDRSGIVALPASLVMPLLRAQASANPVFGSISIDEHNIANLPSDLHKPKGAEVGLPGFVLDKYYRAPFVARKLESDGLFGAGSVLRDHYQEFYDGVDQAALLRCKHYSVPVIAVSNVDELRAHVGRIPKRDVNGIFFRGQTSFYELKRDEAVKRLLFADSCSVEPSLVTSAVRHGFDYDALHFALRYFLQEKVFSAGAVSGKPTGEAWRELASSPLCELDYALMALAQHYGMPSHGLDVTLDLDVATWFATNRFVSGEAGRSRYARLEAQGWPADPLRWPVIFACQMVTHSTRQSLHDCHELADFGFGARRPAAQQAKFFLGGHSDHQNRLAECVVCVFRLHPGFYDTEATFDRLFPAPDDDPAYRLMLEFAAADPFRSFARYVNRFH